MSVSNTALEPIHVTLQTKINRSPNAAISIAPELAQRIIVECPFPGQRRRKIGRVDKHLNRIVAGTWHPDLSTITCAKLPDCSLQVVDGFHRLNAIVQAGRSVWSRVVLVAVASNAEAKKLYAAFDEPSSVRNDSEMLDGIGVIEEMGLPRRGAQKLFCAASLLLNNMEPMGPSEEGQAFRERDARVNAMREWKGEASLYLSLCDKAEKSAQRVLLTQGVMASALYLLRHCPEEAFTFWDGLTRNDGLRRNDPRARLLADFYSRNVATGSIRQRVQRVAVAWNAFYEGRDLSIIKCLDGAAIVFKGTPKSGKQQPVNVQVRRRPLTAAAHGAMGIHA